MSSSSASPKSTEQVFSPFEFWPAWRVYIPVILQWFWHTVKSRSFTVSLLANPEIPLGGMVGAPKSSVLSKIEGEELKAAVIPWFVYHRAKGWAGTHVPLIEEAMKAHGFSFPVVFKPDCGCRGAGVRKIHSQGEILSYLLRVPGGTDIFIQKLAVHQQEAGIFYVRSPDAERGEVVSLTFKQMPVVTGNGHSELEELVGADLRAGLKPELYRDRLRHRWHEIIPEGETVPLVFSASHCRGAVFHDARDQITMALEDAIDRLMLQLPGFHYGRLDVKYPDLQSLKKGEGLEIIEINGASAEQIHIWDSSSTLKDARSSLLWQYQTLFRLGCSQRRLLGLKPPGLIALLKGWWRERAITRHFPVTD